jgi:hypothetical protein
MKIRPVGAEVFEVGGGRRASGQTDRQIDMMNLTVAFRKFSKAPKKGIIKIYISPIVI